MSRTQRLIEQGHMSHGGRCEKCWDEAWLRWLDDPSKSQLDHYFDVMAESEDLA